MKTLYIMFVVALASSGCAISTSYVTSDGKLPAASTTTVAPETVNIYAGIPEGLEFDIIALVAADRPGDGADAREYLQNEAANLGANAVIEVQLTKLNSFSGRTGLSGIAVFVTGEVAAQPDAQPTPEAPAVSTAQPAPETPAVSTAEMTTEPVPTT